MERLKAQEYKKTYQANNNQNKNSSAPEFNHHINSIQNTQRKKWITRGKEESSQNDKMFHSSGSCNNSKYMCT